MFKRKFYTFLIGAALLPGSIVHAETTENPLPSYPDGAPVVLSGTIDEVRSDEFDLNYGSGKITIELDGWGWTGNETNYLRKGEHITISGRIDDDMFEGREVEADNIFLQDSSVYYYTNDMYPSYYLTYQEDTTEADGSYVSMRGTVSKISGREFTLTSSNNSMTVDTANLDYDPFDDEGLQKISEGSRVYVSGEIDEGFFESREIVADSIVMLSPINSAAQN